MSVAAPGQRAQWLLLDTAQAQQALITLRQGFSGVRSMKLFHGTEFQPVDEQVGRRVPGEHGGDAPDARVAAVGDV